MVKKTREGGDSMAKMNWDRENKRKQMFARVNGDESTYNLKYKLLFAEAKARAEKKRMEEFLSRKEVIVWKT